MMSVAKMSAVLQKKDLMIENKRRNGTCKGLGNDNRGVQLESGKQTFKPIWKKDAGRYLWDVQGCGSSAINKCEMQRKKE